VRGMLQLALTLALQATGQVELAEQMLMAAVAQAELAPSGSHAPLRPLLCLISVYFTEGNVVAAAQASRSFLQKSLEAKSLLNQQMAYLALGAAAYEMNELEAAADFFERGADLRHAGNVRAGHECLVGRVLACHALGRSEAVRATIAQLADYHAEVASSVLTAEAISLQRRLGLLNSGFSITDLLRRSVPVRTGIWYGWLEVPAITQVRIALTPGQGLAQGRNLAQVEAALQKLMATAVELHKPGYQAALLALKAILLHRRKQPVAALEALRQAVILGEERGLVRSIADAGPQLEPLLGQLASIQPSDYLDRLRVAVGGWTARPTLRENSIAIAPLAEPLTRREREVLNLLGQHRTDREIAEALVISPLTVRTHIENLSSKLAVNGRRAIVSRAREYGLLA
jgi:LuxR family transcriptional regulator, maltose regulon positive regulatory protein